MAPSTPQMKFLGLFPSPELEKTILESSEYVRDAADKLRDFYNPYTRGIPLPEGTPALVFFDSEDREKICAVGAKMPLESYLPEAREAGSIGGTYFPESFAMFIATVSGTMPRAMTVYDRDTYFGILGEEAAHLLTTGLMAAIYSGRQDVKCPLKGTYGDLSFRLYDLSPHPDVVLEGTELAMDFGEYVALFGAAFLEKRYPSIGLAALKKRLDWVAAAEPGSSRQDEAADLYAHIPAYAAAEWFVEHGGVEPFLAAHPDALGNDFGHICQTYIADRKIGPSVLSSEFFERRRL